MKFTFWGVRGSIPSPGPDAVKYGGNTPCVELWFDDKLIILDAGSGIRPLGLSLSERFKTINANIFITHMHWDHIQGLPFFAPFRNSKNKFSLFGCEEADIKLDQIIADQMKTVYFPVSLDDLTATINFQKLYEEEFVIDDVSVKAMYVNHPGNTLGYRFEYKKQVLVYVSDNEPYNAVSRLNEEMNDDDHDYFEDNNKRIIELAKDADVLIHDSQYFPEEYKDRVTWGHSPFTYTVDIAIAAGVKHLFLYHHDPAHSDEKLEEKLAESKTIINQSGKKMNCSLARERETIELH